MISIESCTATSNGPFDPVVDDAATAVEALVALDSPPALPTLFEFVTVDNDGRRCINSDGSAFKTFLAGAKSIIVQNI